MRADGPTLVGALAVAVIGLLLLADSAGTVHLTVGVLAPIALAAAGVALLAAGLAHRRE